MVRLLVLLSLASAVAAQEPVSLFDGETLDGWAGDERIWSVRDGCIVGSTVEQRVPRNTYLVWQGEEVRDFELSLQVRLEGDNNSGVQYRCRAMEGFRVAGYQADVHPNPAYAGMLYEEGGRGIVAERGQSVATDPESGAPVSVDRFAAPEAIDLARWHNLRIVARGDSLVHELDGKATVRVVDRYRHRREQGTIALQVHAGAPMTVWFRNLVLRRLPSSAGAAELSVGESSPPQWIWSAGARDGQRLWLQRSFDLPAGLVSARVHATCDNHFELLVNGAPVLSGSDWGRVSSAEVRDHLRPGETNHIVARARNDGGPAAFALRLSWKTEDDDGELVSDTGWQVAEVAEGRSDDTRDWREAHSFGPVGAAGLPWSASVAAVDFGLSSPPTPPQRVRPAEGIRAAAGFRVELLYETPRHEGSWVVLAADDEGRLYTSDQRRGLYRITPAGAAGTTTVERVPVDIGGCQGLLWAFGALYAVVSGSESGLYRLRDGDGDDLLDHVEKLAPLIGGGEHGPHAVVRAPDGENLLVLCGNHTRLPEQLTGSRLPLGWGEDLVLPKLEDPRGHARGIKAPGGYVCLVDPEGEDWELIAAGFRNAYDLAVSPEGELFTFDADMEWDMGLPWYRPTRILHVVDGADFGWRSGSGKWPVYWPDTLPSVLDIGPASPTGTLFGTGSSFPERYRRALYVLDWTYGTMYAVHLARHGETFRGRAEEFVVGKPLALTDAVIGSDGAFYFIVGGRGTRSALYRVVHDGAPAAAPASAIPAGDASAARSDRLERHFERVALELRPADEWRDHVLSRKETWPALTGFLALARQGNPADRLPLLEALGRLRWPDLDEEQRIAWLRAHQLVLIRLGEPDDRVRSALVARLDPLFPGGTEPLDAELGRLLVALRAPALVPRLLEKLDMPPPSPPSWAELVQRNDAYGGTVLRMLENMPPVTAIHYANLLRHVEEGWTDDAWRTYLAFFPRAARHPGGASYVGYLRAIRGYALARLDDEERRALGRIARRKLETRPFRVRPPQGPGRRWTVAEAVAALDGQLSGRDRDAGRNLFFAASCAACHRFDGEGGAVGPDLSSVGNKYGLEDLLRATIEPSADISDQYGSSIVRRNDGTTLFGRVVEDGDVLEVHPPDPEVEPERIPRSEVREVAPSPRSQMPDGLLDLLSAEELRDLMAYLIGGGR